MNLYFEKNVINKKMEEKPGMGKFFEIARLVITIVMIILLLVLANTLPWSESGWIFNIAIFKNCSKAFFRVFFSDMAVV